MLGHERRGRSELDSEPGQAEASTRGDLKELPPAYQEALKIEARVKATREQHEVQQKRVREHLRNNTAAQEDKISGAGAWDMIKHGTATTVHAAAAPGDGYRHVYRGEYAQDEALAISHDLKVKHYDRVAHPDSKGTRSQ